MSSFKIAELYADLDIRDQSWAPKLAAAQQAFQAAMGRMQAAAGAAQAAFAFRGLNAGVAWLRNATAAAQALAAAGRQAGAAMALSGMGKGVQALRAATAAARTIGPRLAAADAAARRLDAAFAFGHFSKGIALMRDAATRAADLARELSAANVAARGLNAALGGFGGPAGRMARSATALAAAFARIPAHLNAAVLGFNAVAVAASGLSLAQAHASRLADDLRRSAAFARMLAAALGRLQGFGRIGIGLNVFGGLGKLFSGLGSGIGAVVSALGRAAAGFGSGLGRAFSGAGRLAAGLGTGLGTVARGFGAGLAAAVAAASHPIRALGGLFQAITRPLAGLLGGGGMGGFGGLGARMGYQARADLAEMTGVHPGRLVPTNWLQEAVEMEKVTANLGRVSGLAGKQLEKLKQELFGTATTMAGASADSILAIAMMGSKLGIAGNQLGLFTRDMTRVSMVLEDIPLDEATARVARLLAVFHKGSDQAINLSSALVRLDQSSTASARDILDVATRMSGTAAFMGLSLQKTLALAAALREAGVPLETAGTSIGQILQRMSSKKDMNQFAALAKMPTGEFKGTLERDPLSALKAVLQGFQALEKERGDVEAIQFLEKLHLDGQRVRGTLLQLGAVMGKLDQFVKESEADWDSLDAVMKGGNTIAATAAAQLQRLHNTIRLAAVEIGTALLPVLKGLADGLQSLFSDLRNYLIQNRPAIEGWARGVGHAFSLVAVVFREWPTALQLASDFIQLKLMELGKVAENFGKNLWKGIKWGFGALLQFLQNAFVGLGEFLADLIGQVFNHIAHQLTVLQSKLPPLFGGGFQPPPAPKAIAPDFTKFGDLLKDIEKPPNVFARLGRGLQAQPFREKRAEVEWGMGDLADAKARLDAERALEGRLRDLRDRGVRDDAERARRREAIGAREDAAFRRRQALRQKVARGEGLGRGDIDLAARQLEAAKGGVRAVRGALAPEIAMRDRLQKALAAGAGRGNFFGPALRMGLADLNRQIAAGMQAPLAQQRAAAGALAARGKAVGQAEVAKRALGVEAAGRKKLEAAARVRARRFAAAARGGNKMARRQAGQALAPALRALGEGARHAIGEALRGFPLKVEPEQQAKAEDLAKAGKDIAKALGGQNGKALPDVIGELVTALGKLKPLWQ